MCQDASAGPRGEVTCRKCRLCVIDERGEQNNAVYINNVGLELFSRLSAAAHPSSYTCSVRPAEPSSHFARRFIIVSADWVHTEACVCACASASTCRRAKKTCCQFEALFTGWESCAFDFLNVLALFGDNPCAQGSAKAGENYSMHARRQQYLFFFFLQKRQSLSALSPGPCFKLRSVYYW